MEGEKSTYVANPYALVVQMRQRSAAVSINAHVKAITIIRVAQAGRRAMAQRRDNFRHGVAVPYYEHNTGFC